MGSELAKKAKTVGPFRKIICYPMPTRNIRISARSPKNIDVRQIRVLYADILIRYFVIGFLLGDGVPHFVLGAARKITSLEMLVFRSSFFDDLVCSTTLRPI